jgi:glucokinase
MLLLAGDVGATKTRLGIFQPGPRQPKALVEATFPSDPSTSLETIVKEFLKQENKSVTSACFGAAGPVVEGVAEITNLPWRLEEEALSKALNIHRIKLLNDLEATAWAIPFLDAADCVVLQEGRPATGGSIAVIAPGTGLGEAYLTWDGRRYLAYACEGGHTDFAPADALQAELLADLRKRFSHVSYERVCSGLAIPDIYRFLKDRDDAEEPAWLAKKLKDADDPTPVIIDAALDKKKGWRLCALTLDLFLSILAAEAGNLALKIMATGGVYLTGGIVFHALRVLKKDKCLEPFRNKGRMSKLTRNMPVYAIINPRVALIGAACWGLQFYKE